MEALPSTSIQGALLWGFAKPLYIMDFATPIGASQITYREGASYTHMHILVMFPTDMGGASLWRLCKAPLSKGFAMGVSQSPSIQGALQSSYREELHYGGFMKSL